MVRKIAILLIVVLLGTLSLLRCSDSQGVRQSPRLKPVPARTIQNPNIQFV